MANKHRAEMAIEIGGKSRLAAMNFSSMPEIEDELGTTIPKLINSFWSGALDPGGSPMVSPDNMPSARMVICVLFHALAVKDASITREKVVEWLDEEGLVHWHVLVVELLSLGLSGADESAEGNAPAPSKK